jgi:hypothetical protein
MQSTIIENADDRRRKPLELVILQHAGDEELLVPGDRVRTSFARIGSPWRGRSLSVAQNTVNWAPWQNEDSARGIATMARCDLAEEYTPARTGCLSKRIVHGCGDGKSLTEWLLRLDSLLLAARRMPSGGMNARTASGADD